jgi:solute carrier family 25 (mitochondrial iron transporter), member 28/37
MDSRSCRCVDSVRSCAAVAAAAARSSEAAGTAHAQPLSPPPAPPANNNTQHMIAGATAGVVEHTAMYPVDTIKTRMQALGHPGQQLQGSRSRPGAGGGASVSRALRAVLRREGVSGLYRGVGAVAWGAGPAHALYFAAYEAARDGLLALDPNATTSRAGAARAASGGTSSSGGGGGSGSGSGGSSSGSSSSGPAPHQHHPSSSSSSLAAHSAAYSTLASALAGASATLVNDAVMTPVDVVKQRLQVAHSPYRGAADCVRRVARDEGVAALWRSYRTTVVMNVPFTAVHFSVYESAKRWLLGMGSGPGEMVREAKEACSEVLGGWWGGTAAGGGEGGAGAAAAAAAEAATAAAASAKAAPPGRERGEQGEGEDEEEEGLLVQLVAGGLAGGSAAAVTTPLDVVKTRLQTEGVGAPRRYGGTTRVLPVLRRIAQEEGGAALWRGWKPRVMFHVPAAAVCWGTYETCKRVLAAGE